MFLVWNETLQIRWSLLHLCFELYPCGCMWLWGTYLNCCIIIYCMHTPWSIYPRTFGCFQFFNIVHDIAINTCTFLLDCMQRLSLRVDRAGFKVQMYWVFLGIALISLNKLLSRRVHSNIYSQQQLWECPFFYILVWLGIYWTFYTLPLWLQVKYLIVTWFLNGPTIMKHFAAAFFCWLPGQILPVASCICFLFLFSVKEPLRFNWPFGHPK